MSRRLIPNSDAFAGAFGSPSAWGGAFGLAWAPVRQLAPAPSASTGSRSRSTVSLSEMRRRLGLQAAAPPPDLKRKRHGKQLLLLRLALPA